MTIGRRLLEPRVKEAIIRAVASEPYAKNLKLELVYLEDGHSVVEMAYDPAFADNIYGRAHGGAIYSLIDEAFQAAGQTGGTIAVALNVNVTYTTSPKPHTRLRAEARRVSQTKKTAGYHITVTDQEGLTIATCQALAYCTGKPIPFL
jgi:acyl-CoA thioesterase